MTRVYFVRHAESDNAVLDGRVRPLTEKGLADRGLVTAFLSDKDIDVMLSSPFKRAVDTIAHFAEIDGFEIEMVEGFGEQISSSYFDDKEKFPDPIVRKQAITDYLKHRWADFSYKISDDDDGETLLDVQKRNIAALSEVLTHHRGKNIVIGTHSTKPVNHHKLLR